jgi:predicted nucleic acid-binding protein
MQIDKSESSAIALALETPNSTVILDDFKARKIAERLGLRFTGTLGVMVKAKLQGEIPSIKPLLEKMHGRNFHLSPELEEMVLQQANEK